MLVSSFFGACDSRFASITYRYSGAWWRVDAQIYWKATVIVNGEYAASSNGSFRLGDVPAKAAARRAVEKFIQTAELNGALVPERLKPGNGRPGQGPGGSWQGR